MEITLCNLQEIQTKNRTLYYSPNHVANNAPDTLFCSSVPPVDCSRARVLFVFACVPWCVLYFLCLCHVSCVPNEASFQTKNRTLYHFPNHVAKNAPDTLFCSSVPPVDCSRARVLFVFVSVSWCFCYFVCLRHVSCVSHVASFSGLSIL